MFRLSQFMQELIAPTPVRELARPLLERALQRVVDSGAPNLTREHPGRAVASFGVRAGREREQERNEGEPG